MSKWVILQLARELDIKPPESDIRIVDMTKSQLCVFVKHHFSERCEGAEHLPRSKLIDLVNNRILFKTPYRVGPETPKRVLCSAMALSLRYDGTPCSIEGIGPSIWRCLFIKNLGLVRDKPSWLTSIGSGVASVAKLPLSIPASLARAGLGTGRGGHSKGLKGIAGAGMAKLGRYLTGEEEAEAHKEKVEQLYATDKPVVSRAGALRSRSIAPWESVYGGTQGLDRRVPIGFDRRTLDAYDRYTIDLGHHRGLIRVFSQNCHLRPLPTAIHGRWVPGVGDFRCGEVNFDDVQMKRACQIVTSIKALRGTSNEPHVICLQEAFGAARQKRIITGLRELYPYVKRGIEGSGALTLFRVPLLKSLFVPFAVAAGADHAPGINKGILMTAHRVARGKILVVVNIHPSAYVNVLGFNKQDVYEAHLAQLTQIRRDSNEFVRSLLAKDVALIRVYAGDFNINRYASVPGGRKEKDFRTAGECCSFEYMQTKFILDAEAPPQLPDTSSKSWYDREAARWSRATRFTLALNEVNGGKVLNPDLPVKVEGHGGIFSWDGSENTVAINDLWDEQFQLIDFVMYSKRNTEPYLMDNRIVRLPQRDVIPWIRRPMTRADCHSEEALDSQGRQLAQNRRLGISWRTSGRGADKAVDLRKYGDGAPEGVPVFDPETKEGFEAMDTCGFSWEVFQSLSPEEKKDFAKSWKSGFFNLDFKPTGRQPDGAWTQPYQMYNNISDHYGVSANIFFPHSVASEFFDELRTRRRLPTTPPLGSLLAMPHFYEQPGKMAHRVLGKQREMIASRRTLRRLRSRSKSKSRRK